MKQGKILGNNYPSVSLLQSIRLHIFGSTALFGSSYIGFWCVDLIVRFEPCYLQAAYLRFSLDLPNHFAPNCFSSAPLHLARRSIVQSLFFYIMICEAIFCITSNLLRRVIAELTKDAGQYSRWDLITEIIGPYTSFKISLGKKTAALHSIPSNLMTISRCQYVDCSKAATQRTVIELNL